SEEHTSELQSLTNLVCRLLLEKKKGRLNAKLRGDTVDTDRNTALTNCTYDRLNDNAVLRSSLRRLQCLAVESCVVALTVFVVPATLVVATYPLSLRQHVLSTPYRDFRVPHAFSGTAWPQPPGRGPGCRLDCEAWTGASAFFFLKDPAPPRHAPFSPTQPSPD